MSNAKSTLPESWVIAPLFELLESLESGSRPKGGVRGIESGIPSIGGEHLDSDGGFKLSNIRYVPESFADSMTKGKIETGDILVVKDGATTGKVSYVSSAFPYKKAVVNEHVFLCRISNLLSSKYVFYYLFSDQGKQEILEDFRGAAQGGISQRFASLVQIPLAPVNEQQRIVEKLEELLSDLDAGIEELKSAQAKLVQYRQSLLKSAVVGTLTAEWRTKNTPKETGEELLQRILKERRKNWEEKQLAKYKEQGKKPPKGWQDKYPEPLRPDTKDLPELPHEWVWTSLDALINNGPQNGLYLPKSNYGNGVPILRIDDFQIGWNRERNKLYQVLVDQDLLNTYSLNLGELVINRVNSMTHLGKSIEISKELEGILFESNMMRIQLTDLISPSFVVTYLGSDFGRNLLIKNAKWAVNQASINQQDVRNTPVPLMSIEEQAELNKSLKHQFEAIDNQLLAVEKGFNQLAVQRKNILKFAFTGQLVSQNLDDESASILLEQVQAQKKEQQRLPKQKKGLKKIWESQNMTKTLIEVLTESGDWLPAQEAFKRCGMSDGATTDEIEAIYSQLRQLDQANKLEVNTVYFDDGRKQFDRIRLLAKD